MHCVDLGESFPTRIYLQKIGVDTAENESLEVWGENSIQYSLHSLVPERAAAEAGRAGAEAAGDRQPS